MSEEINIVSNAATEKDGSLNVRYSGTFGAAIVKGVVTFRCDPKNPGGEVVASGWTHNGPPGFAEAGQAHAERAAARFIMTDPVWGKATVVDSQMLRERRVAAQEAAEAPARKAAHEAAVTANKAREHATTEAQHAEPKPAFIPGARLRREAREKAARNTP